MRHHPRAISSVLVFVLPVAALAAACGGGSSGGSSQGEPSTASGHGGAKGGESAAGASSGGTAGAKASGGSGGASASGASGQSGAAGQGGASGPAGAAGSAGNAAKGGAAGAAGASGNTNAGASSAGKGGAAAATCTNPISLALTPGPSVVVDVTGGASAPITFDAVGTCADDTTSVLSAAFVFDRLDLGTINPGGVFQASNDKGGTGTVTATYGSLTASTSVQVVLHLTSTDPTITPDQQTELANPVSTSGIDVVYPYDQTVFARGLQAPEIMWNGSATGDACLVTISEASVTLNTYLTVADAGRFQLDQPTWEQLTTSNAGEDVTIQLSCLSQGTVIAPKAQTWKVAQGSLRGSIYYWAVDKGEILKITSGASAAMKVFDSGPPDQLGTPVPPGYDGKAVPWDANDSNQRCVACHTVSKDGSTLASTFSARGSQGPWGTVNLATSSVASIGTYTENTMFQSLSPDGSVIVTNFSSAGLELATTADSVVVPSLLDTFGDHTAAPTFSPDGSKLAFAGNVNSTYPVEFTNSSLDIVDYDASGKVFANRRSILPLADPAAPLAITFPSFSPGSDFVVYQAGDYSRARYGGNNDQVGHDDLYVTDVGGMLGPIPMGLASGANLAAQNQHISYQPTVNPIAVGGYMWVVFVSPRDYGNRMVSTKTNPTNDNHKQLWVAAVDLNPAPGVDPSHPAFLLRGQNLDTINMSGYWSLDACRQDGQTCEAGYDCCGGFCRSQPDGTLACVPPPANACSTTGERCSGTADCCVSTDAPTNCIGGYCAAVKPLARATRSPARTAFWATTGGAAPTRASRPAW